MSVLHLYNRPSWDDTYSSIMHELAKRSSCLKLKTSALIVKNNQIIAMGYNGTFDKHTECHNYWLDKYKKMDLSDDMDISSFDEWIKSKEFKELHRNWSKCNENHAEANALRWISAADTNNCTMYTLYSPCSACAKDIIAHKIKTVYYKYMYKHGIDAIDILGKANINVLKIKD